MKSMLPRGSEEEVASSVRSSSECPHPTQRTAVGRGEERRGLEDEEREIGSRGVPARRQSRAEPRSSSLGVLPGSMQGPGA